MTRSAHSSHDAHRRPGMQGPGSWQYSVLISYCTMYYCFCQCRRHRKRDSGGSAPKKEARRESRCARSAPRGPESGDAKNHRQPNTTTTTTARVGGTIRISTPNRQVLVAPSQNVPWTSATATTRNLAAHAMHETARHPGASPDLHLENRKLDMVGFM